MRRRSAQALYILGDLFEAWVGDDDADPDKRAYLPGLRALTDSRRAVLRACTATATSSSEPGFCERTGCRLLTDPVIAQLEGERVLLTHGDALCTDDHAYQELRSMVRRPALAAALPRAAAQRVASSWRTRRAPAAGGTPRAPCPPSWTSTPAAVAARVPRARGVRRMIHGHTHRPGVHDSRSTAPRAAHRAGRVVRAGKLPELRERGSYQLRELPR